MADETTEAGGNATPEPKPTRTRKPAAPKAKPSAKPTTKRAPAADLPDGWDWKAKGLPARVLKLKASGKTIKEITEELGLPAREGVWHRVSLIYRAEADRRGADRPRRNGTVKEAK